MTSGLQAIQSQLMTVIKLIHEKDADETRIQLWDRVCFRLDVVGLIVFNVINIVIFADYLQ